MRRHLLLTLLGGAALLALPAGAAAAPSIVSAQVEGDPLLGEPVSLVVVARDRDKPVTGLAIEERGGLMFAESACLIGRDGRPATRGAFGPGRATRFELPYTPARAGIHILRATVTSGGCGSEAESVGRSIAVTVTLPKLPPLPIARAAASSCRGAEVVPTASRARTARSATLCLINRHRRARGMSILRTHSRLRAAAIRHTSDMLRRGYFDHSGPNGPDLASRLKRTRFWPAVAAENLGRHGGAGATPAAMVSAWMGSDIHRVNILTASFRNVGIGILPGVTGGNGGATYTVDFAHR